MYVAYLVIRGQLCQKTRPPNQSSIFLVSIKDMDEKSMILLWNRGFQVQLFLFYTWPLDTVENITWSVEYICSFI